MRGKDYSEIKRTNHIAIPLLLVSESAGISHLRHIGQQIYRLQWSYIIMHWRIASRVLNAIGTIGRGW